MAAPKRPVSAARLLDSLAGQGLIGLCLFDEAGQVAERIGLAEGVGPAPAGNVQDWPPLAGMWDAIRGLKIWGGAIDLPGLGASGESAARHDLRIAWLQALNTFALLFSSADARVQFEFAMAQPARENRLLLERIRQQQAQIEAQNALLKGFIDQAPAAIALLDADFNYILASKRWLEDFRAPLADLSGQPFGKGVAGRNKRLEKALRRKDGAVRGGVEKLARPDGAPEWLRWEQRGFDHPGLAPGGRLVFAENISRAVEQTARLRGQARRLAAMADQMQVFALAASHDLRAPLRQIAAFAGLLDESRAALGGEGEAFLGSIQDCAARMLEMIDALLRYARLGYRDSDATQFPLARAVAAAGANLQAEIARRGGVVEVTPNVHLRGDFALFVSLLQNLIDNALKYGPAASPRIEISASADEGGLRLAFSDNGPGIPPSRQAKAFEMFQRLGAGAELPGSGVGLALCRKIVELHGGEMSIDAEFAGGLRLLMRLPAEMGWVGRRRRG